MIVDAEKAAYELINQNSEASLEFPDYLEIQRKLFRRYFNLVISSTSVVSETINTSLCS